MEIKELSVDTALRIAEEIESKYALGSIAKFLAKAGEFDKALELAERYDLYKGWMAVEISYDDEEKAEEIFKEYPLEYCSKSIISSQFTPTPIDKCGLSKDRKIRLLEMALKSACFVSNFYEIALSFAKLGEVDRALDALTEALNKEDNLKWKVKYLYNVAKELYVSGYRKEALNLFENAFDIALSLDKEEKDFSLSSLSKSLAEVGEIDFALRVAEKIDDDFHLEDALIEIILSIYLMNKMEYADRVFELAEKLDDLKKEVLVESICYKKMHKLKYAKEVGDLLRRLEDLAESIDNSSYRDEALSYLAKAYAVIGEYDHALELAEKIDDEWYRNVTIGYIAYRLAKDGDKSRAKSLIENLNYGSELIETLCYIRLGEIDKAKNIIVQSLDRSSNICTALLELMDVGRFEDAIELIEATLDKIYHLGLVHVWHPDYISDVSLIHKILSSDLAEEKKIKYINRICIIYKDNCDILAELAEEIAWYALRDKIAERAKRLEEKGYIEKAIELYETADKLDEAERLRKNLVNVEIEYPSKLEMGERGKIKVRVDNKVAVYDLKIEFKARNIKIYKDGQEIDSFTVESIPKYSTHEESFEIVPLKPGISTISASLTFTAFYDTPPTTKTVEKLITIRVPEPIDVAKKPIKEEISPMPITTDAITSNFPSQLLSKYEPLELLGEGGFSLVFKCKRKSDGKLVAVKIPKEEEAEETGKSFIEEIANWKKLKHINIVELQDYNVLPYPYIEMELCDCTLMDVSLTFKEKLKVAYRIADALSYAHSRGVIHGDLKPSNVLIRRIGDEVIPKLSDWGMGYTLAYAPPEIILNELKPDEQTDIWSFGVLLYELVTGVNPFQGEDDIETMDRIVETDPDLSPLGMLKPIVAKCLEKDRNKRYKSMMEVRRDLANLNVSTLSDIFSRSKSRREKVRTSMEIINTYISIGDFDKAEKRMESLIKYKFLPHIFHEIYKTIMEILLMDTIPLDTLELKYRHIIQLIPEKYRAEFENDEHIGGLIRMLSAHFGGDDVVFDSENDEYHKIKNVFCIRLLDRLGEIAMKSV